MAKLVLLPARRHDARHPARPASASRSAGARTTTSACRIRRCRREHAAVVTVLADSFLQDLGSTNGTLVNGQPVSEALPARPRPDRHRPPALAVLQRTEARAEPLPPDVLRREVRGLHEQVERARTAGAPGAIRARSAWRRPIDPLMPDDELLADMKPPACRAERAV